MRTYCAAGIGPPFADPTVSGCVARRPTNDFSCNVPFFEAKNSCRWTVKSSRLHEHPSRWHLDGRPMLCNATARVMDSNAVWPGSPVENDPAVNFSLLHCQSPCNGLESDGRLLLQ